MNGVLVLLIILVIAAIAFVVYNSSQANGRKAAESLADAQADARRIIERLGGQVLNLTGSDNASKQAMADASERYTAASSQIDQANTVKQAELAKESAIEGLYYVRAARTAMGMDPGPELESLAGQRSAGTVTEDRRVEFEGRQIEASPTPSERTPNYYPGGRVAGRHGRNHPGRTVVELVIHEGRNRIVRRLLAHVGHPVLQLTRTRIGPVQLGRLGSGELRDLGHDELGLLLDSAQL